MNTVGAIFAIAAVSGPLLGGLISPGAVPRCDKHLRHRAEHRVRPIRG